MAGPSIFLSSLRSMPVAVVTLDAFFLYICLYVTPLASVLSERWIAPVALNHVCRGIWLEDLSLLLTISEETKIKKRLKHTVFIDCVQVVSINNQQVCQGYTSLLLLIVNIYDVYTCVQEEDLQEECDELTGFAQRFKHRRLELGIFFSLSSYNFFLYITFTGTHFGIDDKYFWGLP